MTVQTTKVKAEISEDTIKLQASSSFKPKSGIELDIPDLMNGQKIKNYKEEAFKYKYDGKFPIFQFVS